MIEAGEIGSFVWLCGEIVDVFAQTVRRVCGVEWLVVRESQDEYGAARIDSSTARFVTSAVRARE